MTKTRCSFGTCRKPVRARDLCHAHYYERWLRRPRPPRRAPLPAQPKERQTRFRAPQTAAEDDWRLRGICATAPDPDRWFPVGDTGAGLAQAESAKAECRRCPVMEQCLQWALDTRQVHGVWGGLSEGERRAILRRGARAKASV